VSKERKFSNKNTLKFYIVSDRYIEYLSSYDTHVSWNKKHKRPYIGIVLKIERYLYFAPLYSYKENYKKYKENPSFMRVEDRKGRALSIIRFSEMIPVPKEEINLLDIEMRGKKYKDLLQTEMEFINDNKVVCGRPDKVETLLMVIFRSFARL